MAPPARAGFARYLDSIVSAVAGQYRKRPNAGEQTVRKKIRRTEGRFSRRPHSRAIRAQIFFIVRPPWKSV